MTKAELYQKACMLPLLPGVYIIRDKSDTIIYIGKIIVDTLPVKKSS